MGKKVSLLYHVETKFKALEKATRLALSEREKAIDKAEKSIGERLTLLNELRGGVPTKEQFEALAERVTDLKERQDKLEGNSTGKKALWGYGVAALGVFATIASLIALVMK